MIDLVGHDRQLKWFAAAMSKGRLSGTFLLVGPPGIGKALFAKAITKCLFCESTGTSSLSACGRCDSCIQVEAGTHPDLVQVRKPADRATIPLDLLIGPPEARMREGFCRDIRLRPFRGTRKVAILHDADFLNEEGANSLLKTLEEPPPDAVVFLIATNEQRQLPTIRSRCRIIRFTPPRGELAAKLMRQRGIVCDAARADHAVEVCGGDYEAAATLLAGDADSFQRDFVNLLSAVPIPAVNLAKTVAAIVDEAGKEPAQRRDRLRDILAMAVATFRDQLKTNADDAGSIGKPVFRIERTIDAISHTQRNANQALMIEAWATDIARGHIG